MLRCVHVEEEEQQRVEEE
jgi:hypothetical protein